MISSLSKILRDVGLHEKQSTVLEILLENGGSMLVAAIAKAAKLNRTTTYDIVRELVEEGLASKVKREGVFRYQSVAPEALTGYIERRRDVLKESKNELAKLVPQIKLLRSKGRVLPKVQFFEGKEGVEQAYEDVIENNSQKLLRGITGMDSVYNDLDNAWLEYYLKKRTRLGVQCIDLVPETEGGKRSKTDDSKYIRTTKFLPANVDFAGDISIYDNKVNIASFARENPVAVIIEDDAIADMMKKLFDFMAEHAK